MSIFSAQSPQEFFISLIIRLLIIFTVLPVHEYAHAVAARKMGDNTALISGRLTLNPLAHLDIFGALMMVFIGFGWAKPVPINPRNFTNYKKGISITAFAGPLSNLICAAIGIFIIRIIEGVSLFYFNTALYFIEIAFLYFAQINLTLAIFNLIPIPPLDGSKILFALLPRSAYNFILRYERYGMLILFVLINTSVFSGLLMDARIFLFDLMADIAWLIFS